MGTSNPGIIQGMEAARRTIDPENLDAMVNAAVTAAVSGALSGKADLLAGSVPDSQLPERLSNEQIAITAGQAAVTAVNTALSGRNLPLPDHVSSVALGASTTAENQLSGGAKHLDLQPSTTPLAPTSGARLWVSVVGGKQQVNIIFPTGTPITLATEA